MCVSVCLSVREHISPTTRAIFTQIFRACCLSPQLGYRPAGLRNHNGKGQFCGFSPIDNALYSGMNFATMDRFRLHLLIYCKVIQNSISYY